VSTWQSTSSKPRERIHATDVAKAT
jgi:hypothetical protein